MKKKKITQVFERALFIFLTSFIYDSHDIIMEDLCTIVLGVLIALVIFSVCG
jgi:hypothetical protein